MTEITIGAPLGASYVNADGTPGRPVDVSLLEGTFVKSVEPSGDTLTIVLQDANNEQMALTFAPALAAGSGAKTFLAEADYDDSTGVLEFTAYQGGTPSGIGAGDLIIFAAPSNIDDDQDITVDDTVNTRVDELYDLDDNVVQGHQLSPGRAYFIFRDVRGSGQRYRLTLPLGLDQITPTQTATVTITNAQLKTLDTDPVEIIAAPGAGHFIEILRFKITASGSDAPTLGGSAIFDARANLVLGYVVGSAATSPYFIVSNIVGGVSGELYLIDIVALRTAIVVTGYSTRKTAPPQTLYENTPLMFSVALTAARSQAHLVYTEDIYDAWWATANDNTIEIEVDYFVHD